MKNEINADVIVAGGGLAGTFAAIAVKKTNPNAEVWLIERFGYLGGMATAGYVFPFMNHFARSKDQKLKSKRLSGGLFRDMMEIMHKQGYTEKKRIGPDDDKILRHFDPQMMRCVLDEMILEHGIKVLFHAMVNKATTSNRKIEKIYIQTKAGEIVGNAKYFVDATGDADLIFHGKGAFKLGRKSDGLTQPSTTNFRIGNISKFDPPRQFITKKLLAAKKAGIKLTPRNDNLMWSTTGSRERHFNQTRVAGYDFTDPFQFSEAEMESRKQAKRYFEWLVREIKGYKKSNMIGMAHVLGVRETRRIVGEYILTSTDLVKGTYFDDRICLANYSIDIHDPKGSANTEIIRYPRDHFYCIPYRSLIPKDFTNVLVAGRPISASHRAHSAIRIMPICSTIGHAAGVAMGLILKQSQDDVREVEINKLQDTLRLQRACID